MNEVVATGAPTFDPEKQALGAELQEAINARLALRTQNEILKAALAASRLELAKAQQDIAALRDLLGNAETQLRAKDPNVFPLADVRKESA